MKTNVIEEKMIYTTHMKLQKYCTQAPIIYMN